MSVSGAVFDKFPARMDERKTLHFKVDGDMVSVWFSDLVNFVNMKVISASNAIPFTDTVGFLRYDVNIHTAFSDSNYFTILDNEKDFCVPLFDKLVSMKTKPSGEGEKTNEIIDDCVYTPFCLVDARELKELLDLFVPLVSLKSSTKGGYICNRLCFYDGNIYLIAEDSSFLQYHGFSC